MFHKIRVLIKKNQNKAKMITKKTVWNQGKKKGEKASFTVCASGTNRMTEVSQSHVIKTYVYFQREDIITVVKQVSNCTPPMAFNAVHHKLPAVRTKEE